MRISDWSSDVCSSDLVKDTSFGADDVHIRWFADGTTNACYNCIDRHLPAKKDDTAIIWEGDDPSEQKHISYGELFENVCRLANARSEEHTSELQSLMRSSYAVFCLKKKKHKKHKSQHTQRTHSGLIHHHTCITDER